MMGFGGEGRGYVPPEAYRAPQEEKKENVEKVDPPAVPEREIVVRFDRSSGPGGQNVNKRSTKAVLHWNVGHSQPYNEEQKELIRAAAGNRLSKEDEIVISSDAHRSQEQNRKDVIDRLQEVVAGAFVQQKERKPTKPSRNQKAKRMDEKTQHGRKKEDRRKGGGQEGW